MIKFYLDPEDDDELNINPEEWEDIENDILDIMYDREDPDFDNDQISDDADNYCD